MSPVARIPKVYTDEQAARLARISLTQIRYWDGTKFFEPSIGYEDRRVAYSRLYTFDDVVALRVLGELRNKHDVSLQHLRKVRDKYQLEQSAWAEEEIFVHKKRVYFKSERGTFVNSETEEETLPNIPIPRVTAEVAEDARVLGIRPDGAVGKKTQLAPVARKAEVFEGTRIPIDTVKEYISAGYSVDDILSDYPTLKEQDIKAAIRWLGIKAA
jgi:DNA-binding transcriptional MerR regulator